MRPLKITPDFISTAEGSVLIELGNTRVICTATVDDGVPPFLKGRGKGWVTSEYGMLPRATEEDRKSTRLNSSHSQISYAVFCLKKKNIKLKNHALNPDYV